MVKICVVCGRPFENRHPQTRTCSPECSKALTRQQKREAQQRYYARGGPLKSADNPPIERACNRRKMEGGLICHPAAGDCARCGWNPDVERERIRRNRAAKLKTCPMCAAAAGFEYGTIEERRQVRVRCAVCKLSTARYEDAASAAIAWNTREG